MAMLIYITSLSSPVERQGRPQRETRAGRALLALGLMRGGWLPEGRLPAQVDITSMLDFGPRGKPGLVGLPVHFNISHSHGLVACALGGGPVGLDVERVRGFSPQLAERIGGEGERRLAAGCGSLDSGLTQVWTCKESYMKYTGLGMAQGIAEIRLSRLGPAPRLAGQPGLYINSMPLWRGGEPFWLSVCRAGAGPLALEFVPGPALGL